MRIALCDFDDKYLSSLLSYLYGKCNDKNFATFTGVGDYCEAINSKSYDYTVMGDEFYESYVDMTAEALDGINNAGKLIILSSTIDDLVSNSEHQVIYKYGPMDGLYRMMEHKKSGSASGGKRLAVYSPTHHELTEMYGLSLCQMFAESQRVLLIDMMHCPIIKKLIRDGPRGGIIDAVYKLENNKASEIQDLIEEYSGIDVMPLATSPMDVASISKQQWKMLLEYISTLNYEVFVFLIDEINQGFREIIENVDSCILINRRGDYYKDTQDYMKEYIRNLGTSTTPVELIMSANNLNEGCYQLEELLTGNLGRYVRHSHIYKSDAPIA